MESRSFSDQVYRRRPKQLEPCSEEDGSHLEDSKMICSEEHGWESDSALKIFVFSQQQFCRGCCMPTMPYKTLYLVHPIGSKTVLTSKEKTSEQNERLVSEEYSWRHFQQLWSGVAEKSVYG